MNYATRQAEQFIEAARGLVGAPFEMGGRDPARGIDCAGLVVYAAARRPRVSALERWRGHRPSVVAVSTAARSEAGD